MAQQRQAQPPPLPAAADAADADSAANQRRASRVVMNVEIGIDDHTNFYVGFSENISAGGLFIATYRLMPVGTQIALTFVLPDQYPVFVQAVVRWLRDPIDSTNSETPPGMGVEFCNLGELESERVQAYINMHAPLFFPD
jgi:uncharacterized protein (TIGR02266 family)